MAVEVEQCTQRTHQPASIARSGRKPPLFFGFHAGNGATAGVAVPGLNLRGIATTFSVPDRYAIASICCTIATQSTCPAL